MLGSIGTGEWLYDIFGYATQYIPALLIGIGIGLLIGIVIIGVTAVKHFDNGKEAGLEEALKRIESYDWRKL